tara:strand:- start:175 stop:642 length:468 start_codon:yes stop_codon:yes gene_type:complete
MMKNQFIKIICGFLLLVGCGFSVVTNDANFRIVEVKTTGDKEINYFLKNKLLLNSLDDKKKSIKLNVNTKKTKSIKEKNISNQITKYEIKLELEINYIISSKNLSEKFIIVKNGSYDVATKYSETLNNEKNLINLLVNDLADDILYNLKLNLDDL